MYCIAVYGPHGLVIQAHTQIALYGPRGLVVYTHWQQPHNVTLLSHATCLSHSDHVVKKRGSQSVRIYELHDISWSFRSIVHKSCLRSLCTTSHDLCTSHAFILNAARVFNKKLTGTSELSSLQKHSCPMTWDASHWHACKSYMYQISAPASHKRENNTYCALQIHKHHYRWLCSSAMYTLHGSHSSCIACQHKQGRHENVFTWRRGQQGKWTAQAHSKVSLHIFNVCLKERINNVDQVQWVLW